MQYSKRQRRSIENDELLRHVLNSCPIPISLIRAKDGKTFYESPAVDELLGRHGQHAVSSFLNYWVNPQDWTDYFRRLREGGQVERLEARLRKADGREFPCSISSRLVKHQGEEVIVSGLCDLTELRAAQAEVVQQRKMLNHSARLSAMGELLAGISHELSNPLTVLVVQAATLEEAALDEQTAKQAARISRAAERCARIVKAFLAMARKESTEMQQLDFNRVIESAFEMTVYFLRASDIDVSLQLATHLPPVHGDADQLCQVLTNLMVNAHHALQEIDGPRELRISSRYCRQSDRVIVKLKDNGPGVPAEIRSRIFEPMFTTKKPGIGNGMGLSLCHRIMEIHGGRIVLESDSTRGATFVLELPSACTMPPSQTAPTGGAGADGCRVLVVNDEEDLRLTLSEILQADGHQVDYVASGSAALERLKRYSYHVILSDIRMPGLDGLGLFRSIQNQNPSQARGFAFITGDTMSPQLRDSIDSTKRPCIEKPLSTRGVRQLIKLIMHYRSL